MIIKKHIDDFFLFGNGELAVFVPDGSDAGKNQRIGAGYRLFCKGTATVNDAFDRIKIRFQRKGVRRKGVGFDRFCAGGDVFFVNVQNPFGIVQIFKLAEHDIVFFSHIGSHCAVKKQIFFVVQYIRHFRTSIIDSIIPRYPVVENRKIL